jgi:ubiquinone/menaquinone biosynthesis C-methylase UbiE
MDILEKRLKNESGGKILDVATGQGGFVEYLTGLFKDFDSILGIDPAADRISEASAKLAKDNVRFAVMNGEDLALENDSFDTVSISNSLHHLARVDPVLSEMKRVLKPGGRMIVCEVFSDNQSEVQMSSVLMHHWWAEVDRTQGVSHNDTYTRQGIIDFIRPLELEGLEIFEIQETDRDPRDEELAKQLREICQQFMAKIEGRPQYAHLIQKGRDILARMDEVGFLWPTSLCLLGRKPA